MIWDIEFDCIWNLNVSFWNDQINGFMLFESFKFIAFIVSSVIDFYILRCLRFFLNNNNWKISSNDIGSDNDDRVSLYSREFGYNEHVFG